MKTTRRRFIKRNAPRLAGTERTGNYLLEENLNGQARAVNADLRGDRHATVILPTITRQIATATERRVRR